MVELNNKTFSELSFLLKEETDKYNKLNEECLKEGLSWEEACNKMRDSALSIFSIEQEMRLKQDPGIEFGKKWKGKKMTLSEFKLKAINGTLTDSDGVGYYATENAKSDIRIFTTDVIDNKIRSDFSHVIWM